MRIRSTVFDSGTVHCALKKLLQLRKIERNFLLKNQIMQRFKLFLSKYPKISEFSNRFTVLPEIRYKAWSALNSWSTSCSSTLTTSNMLKSLITTPSMSEIIACTYIGKDLIGQLGGLWYIYRNCKKADSEPVKHVTKNSLLLQLGFYMENFAPHVNSNFLLPYLGFVSALKNISFINIGAVNTHNLKKLDITNIGKLYSELSVLNTLSSSLGMLAGIGILYYIPSEKLKTLVFLPLFSFVSVYSMRKGTKDINIK